MDDGPRRTRPRHHLPAGDDAVIRPPSPRGPAGGWRARVARWFTVAEAPGPAWKERRSAERYTFTRTVWLRRRDEVPDRATMKNVSRTGAAVQFRRGTGAADTWLAHLAQGDEVTLCNLVDQPVECWVVAVEDDILRLHFPPGQAADDTLHRLIEDFARRRQAVAAPASWSVTGRRRIRKLPVAAAGGLVAGAVLLGSHGLGLANLAGWKIGIPRFSAHWRAGPPMLPSGKAGAEPGAWQGAAGDNAAAPGEQPPAVLAGGTTFAATLVSGGMPAGGVEVVAEVAEVVRGPEPDRRVLLPRGTRLTGEARNGGGIDPHTVVLVWTGVAFPDGRSLTLLPAGAPPGEGTEGPATPDAARIGGAHLTSLYRRTDAAWAARERAAPAFDLPAGSRIAVTATRDIVLPWHRTHTQQERQ
ncbi:conserved protein of unknown function [Rhodovastum atsumiense]|nr:PilZ domain-containing protein [Rhodovastum atsumiense]CAH2602205.1 conserved protein of unknown function [Rhodovastum atsumiense]